MNIDLT